MPFIPLLIGALGRFLLPALLWLFKTKGGYIVMSILVWLGINWSSMTLVVDPLIDAIRNYAGASGGGIGSGPWGEAAMAWAGVLRMDQAITMLLSAYTTKVTILNARLFLWKRGVGA